ncbi:MAG: UDP-phosphate galactose phosphotransferase [Deltaproteobacteria bacterium]|nr:MAG: UDP-phosphate galactose phosphotransferase [Deltaproteobacteria bacterium]
MLLSFKNYGLYSLRNRGFKRDEVFLVVKGVSFATLILMVFMYLSKIHASRFVVLSMWGLCVFALSGWRYINGSVVERRLADGDGSRNVVIVGAGRVGRRVAGILQSNRHLGFNVKGFLDDYKTGEGVLGRIKNLPDVIKKHFIDEVIITIPSEREVVKWVILEARKAKTGIKIVPELFDGLLFQGSPSIEVLGNIPVMNIYREPIPELGLFVKRVIDIAGAVFGILVSLPLMLAISIAIKIDSPDGPVIYRSRRVGRKGKEFICYKFRTMVPDADALKEKLWHLNERKGPFFKITNDPRVTRVGRFLRKYNLDELPQFFNVLKGDMSLVGPRPHPVDDFNRYSLDHYRRLDVKPGMTSLWAVEAQDDPSFERNLELDLYYIENWSLLLDIKILLRTIPTVLKGVGR